MRALRLRILLLLLLTILTMRTGSAQASIQYMYDELGRLIAVVYSAGDTAVYHYDAVGNITSTERRAWSQVSIIAFSPTSIDKTVTISGTGFSATPSQNMVSFNGTNSTVSSASPTQLVETVPKGAMTGTIGATAPVGSATSATAFTDDATGGRRRSRPSRPASARAGPASPSRGPISKPPPRTIACCSTAWVGP